MNDLTEEELETLHTLLLRYLGRPSRKSSNLTQYGLRLARGIAIRLGQERKRN